MSSPSRGWEAAGAEEGVGRRRSRGRGVAAEGAAVEGRRPWTGEGAVEVVGGRRPWKGVPGERTTTGEAGAGARGGRVAEERWKGGEAGPAARGMLETGAAAGVLDL